MNSKVKNKTAILQIFGDFPSSCLGMLCRKLELQKSLEIGKRFVLRSRYTIRCLYHAWHLGIDQDIVRKEAGV